jgi:cytochrome bd-type quinol oxidase subunit 2
MSITKRTKNHTISKFISKLLTRLFMLLLGLSVAPFLINKDLASRLETTYIYIENKWVFVFPAVLFLSFLTLLVLTGRARHEKEDLNWMLSLNTLLLIVYVILLYVKLYPAIAG